MSNFTKDDTFIVTGANSGIGKGVALMLNKLGASVVGIARNLEKLEQAKRESANPDLFFCETRDFSTDIEGLPTFVKDLKNKYGKFRGLAYCAGIVELKPLQILDEDSMKTLFNINYFAPLFMLKGFADRRINIGRGASCVFIASIAAKTCGKAMISYSGAKAALVSSVKCAARELAKSGIRLNTVSPSDIETPMTQAIPSLKDERLDKYPLGFGSVEDIANVVTFLLSDKAKWITAQDYIVDCGYF